MVGYRAILFNPTARINSNISQFFLHCLRSWVFRRKCKGHFFLINVSIEIQNHVTVQWNKLEKYGVLMF